MNLMQRDTIKHHKARLPDILVLNQLYRVAHL